MQPMQTTKCKLESKHEVSLAGYGLQTVPRAGGNHRSVLSKVATVLMCLLCPNIIA